LFSRCKKNVVFTSVYLPGSIPNRKYSLEVKTGLLRATDSACPVRGAVAKAGNGLVSPDGAAIQDNGENPCAVGRPTRMQHVLNTDLDHPSAGRARLHYCPATHLLVHRSRINLKPETLNLSPSSLKSNECEFSHAYVKSLRKCELQVSNNRCKVSLPN